MLRLIGRLLSSTWSWIRGYPSHPPKGLARPLGDAEKLFAAINQRGILMISSAVFMSTSKELREQNIKWALKRLMYIHPLLRMRIADCGGVLHWMEMEEMEPDFRVDVTEDWYEVFSQNTLEKYSYERGPLWRVTYMPNAKHDYGDGTFQFHCAFVFGFSHTIIDGQARLKLVNDFQDLLSESLNNAGSDFTEIDATLGDPVSLQISPTSQEFIYKKLGFIEKCFYYILHLSVVKRILISRFSSMSKKQNPFVQCIGLISDIKQVKDPKSCVYPMVIERKELSMILKACKRQQVSVQSLLQAASTISICELIMEGAKQKHVLKEDIAESSVACTAAMRQRLPTSTFNDVSYVTSLLYPLNENVNVPEYANEGLFWQFARRIMTTLHAKTESNMKAFLFFQTLMSGKGRALPKTRMNLLSFTNLGNCNFLNRDPQSGVKVTAHYSCSGEHLGGPVFANCITTLDNKMFWGAIYYTNITTKEMAARYLSRALELVLKHSKEIIE